MANTSRKRPPSSNPTTIASSYTPSSSSSSSSTAGGGVRGHNGSSGPVVPPPSPMMITGIDALLAKYARRLPRPPDHRSGGGTITVQLIKGPSSSSVDPIAARRAAALHAKRTAASSTETPNNNTTNIGGGMSYSNGSDGAEETSDDGGGSGRASNLGGAAAAAVVESKFPRLAKFVETVTPPSFNAILKDGRMYEEEVPKARDESDEDESTAYKQSNDNGETLNSGDSTNQKAPSKKKRWRRNDPRPRRWVLQEKSEFFDRIRKRKQRSSTPGGGGGDDDGPVISNQYHGVVESNTSRYVILSVAPIEGNVDTNNNNNNSNGDGSSLIATEKISVQSIHGFHTFSQPYKFASLTMEEAEDAIERKRDVMTRYMMHGRLASAGGAAGGAAIVGAAAAVSRGRPILGPPPKAMSRARLLGKLAGGDIGGFGKYDDDGDDVMGDVRYSSSGGRRGGGGTSKARKELLSTLGDEGVTVDDDGVLGGANDDEFGGRGRFKRVNVQSVNDNGDASAGGSGVVGSGAKTTSTGFEAGAMEEGFYQRDVAAEYEALDYDANEQFDDDDVNVGEDEMMDDGGGYGGDFHDSGGDDGAFDSDDDEGAWSDSDDLGMATKSGLKAMLAKARGKSPVTALDNSEAMESSNSSIASGGGGLGEGIDDLMNAAKKTAEKLLSSTSEDKKSSSASASDIAEVAIAVDKDGKRLITLEAVRREIWVNNGNITSKKLTRLFDVGKKNPERQALFKKIVMELCTIKKDADGNKLVLKQHYSKMQRSS